MKIIGIVQARMSSTRLPGKVLLDAAGKPLIVHMLERVARSGRIQDLWLATSEDKSDDPLAKTVERAGYQVFRGSLENVLSRYWHLASREGADVVVRLTGDCPLHDPEVIDEVIARYVEWNGEKYYVSNVLPPTYPDGLDTEVFPFSALDEAYRNAASKSELEHVCPYIRRMAVERRQDFNCYGPADFSHLRWTLDRPEDYVFVREAFEGLYPLSPSFGWLDVVSWQTRVPERLTRNIQYARNLDKEMRVRPWDPKGGSGERQ